MLSSFLTDKTHLVPNELTEQFSGIITQTRDIVGQISTSIVEQSTARISRRLRWVVSGREDIENLRSSLEAHTTALNLAVDCLALCNTAAIQSATTAIRQEDIPRILREITRLRITVEHSPNIILQRYMADVSEYAESVVGEESIAGDYTSRGAAAVFKGELDMIDDSYEGGPFPKSLTQSSGSDSFSNHPSNIRSSVSAIRVEDRDSASMVMPDLVPLGVLNSDPVVTPTSHREIESLKSFSATKGSQSFETERPPSEVVAEIIKCDRTFSPDKSLIESAEIQRRFLREEDRLALDESLWRIAYDPGSQKRSVELRACLAAGADPKSDKEVDCPGLLNTRGLVWRMVYVEDNESLKSALLFGADHSLTASTAERTSISPLYYAATHFNHEAVELLLHSGADPRKHGSFLDIAFAAFRDLKVPILESQVRLLDLLDVIMARHQIFDRPLSAKLLRAAIKSAATPDSFYGLDVINFLLQEGIFYPDILRDVLQHFQLEYITLDLMGCILEKAKLYNSLHEVSMNLPCAQQQCRNTTPMSMDDLKVLQFLLQKGVTFADYDNLIYSILFAIYSSNIEYPDGFDQDARWFWGVRIIKEPRSQVNTKPRALLVLVILKLIAQQGGRFDVLKKRKWKNMAGLNGDTQTPRSGSERDFLSFITWRHANNMGFDSGNGVRHRKIEKQVLEMALEKPSKIKNGLIKSEKFAADALAAFLVVPTASKLKYK